MFGGDAAGGGSPGGAVFGGDAAGSGSPGGAVFRGDAAAGGSPGGEATGDGALAGRPGGAARGGATGGAGVPADTDSADTGPDSWWRGKRLGLPASGPGSIVGFGPRLGAFLADIVLSALVAGLFTAPELPRNWSLVAFLAEYVAFGAAFGQTPGMRLFGLRLVRVDRPGRVGLVRILVRTAVLALLVPALIWDVDGRCLHERFSQTAVVRA